MKKLAGAVQEVESQDLRDEDSDHEEQQVHTSDWAEQSPSGIESGANTMFRPACANNFKGVDYLESQLHIYNSQYLFKNNMSRKTHFSLFKKE